MKKIYNAKGRLRQKPMIADNNGLGGTYFAIEENQGNGGPYIFWSELWDDNLTHQTVRTSSLRTKDS